MGKITEWLIIEGNDKWVALDFPATYPIKVSARARQLAGHDGWSFDRHEVVFNHGEVDKQIDGTNFSLHLSDNNNGTFSLQTKSTRNATNVAYCDWLINGKSVYNGFIDGVDYKKGTNNWTQEDVQVKSFPYSGKKVIAIKENNKTLSLIRPTTTVYADTDYNTSNQYFKSISGANSTLYFNRYFVCTGDIGDSDRGAFTQSNWNGNQGIAYGSWKSYKQGKTWHWNTMNLDVNVLADEMRKRGVSAVYLNVKLAAGGGNDFYTANPQRNYDRVLKITSDGSVFMHHIEYTQLSIPKDGSQVNLGGHDDGDNRVEWSIKCRADGNIEMGVWMRWNNQRWICAMYFYNWWYDKYI